MNHSGGSALGQGQLVSRGLMRVGSGLWAEGGAGYLRGFGDVGRGPLFRALGEGLDLAAVVGVRGGVLAEGVHHGPGRRAFESAPPSRATTRRAGTGARVGGATCPGPRRAWRTSP